MIGTDSYIILIELSNNIKYKNIDYRFSPISVLNIDSPTKFQERFKMLKRSVEPLKAQHLGEGVIKLYREFEDDRDECSEDSKIQESPDSLVNSSDNTMVSIIAIPSYFTATDILGFIGETYMKSITHIRILKNEKPNRFLVLIKFSDILKASEFQYQYNGKPFNSMEPELCHAIFIKDVIFKRKEGDLVTNEEESARKALIPFLLEDPFTTRQNSPDINLDVVSISENEKLLELPTCPVCLERMDATITGLLTIPCQHTFHCLCLSKWRDDSCPICRYSNSIANRNIRRSTRRLLHVAIRRNLSLQQHSTSTTLQPLDANGTEHTETCMDCDTDSNLWICLICGNLGCDRYAPEQHSLKHFINTGHCFAMELNTSRVWDYAGDNYVHRLVTNESDGKIVELPAKEKDSSSGILNQDKSNSDKVDQVGLEYSQLLISQLASQREYYENLIDSKEAGKARRKSSVTMPSSKVTDLENLVQELKEDLSELTINTIPALKKKLALKEDKINSLTKELNSANSLNDALLNKVDYLISQEEKLKSEIKEIGLQNINLREQVSDLMFFLDNQEKFKDQPDEVKEGTIHIESGPSKKTRSKKKKKN